MFLVVPFWMIEISGLHEMFSAVLFYTSIKNWVCFTFEKRTLPCGVAEPLSLELELVLFKKRFLKKWLNIFCKSSFMLKPWKIFLKNHSVLILACWLCICLPDSWSPVLVIPGLHTSNTALQKSKMCENRNTWMTKFLRELALNLISVHI